VSDRTGRPLRFLGAVGGSWVALRIAIVWQATGSLPEAIRQVVPGAKAEPAALMAEAPPPRAPAMARGSQRVAVHPAAVAVPGRGFPTADPVRVALALAAAARFGDAIYLGQDGPLPVRQPPATPTAAVGGTGSRGLGARLSVSSWMIARDGTGIGASPTAPQLGGAQGGVRVDYAVGGGFAATGRIAAPAAGSGRELSLGIAYRPGALPVRLVAEQRIALDNSGSGPALGISGGVSAKPLAAGFKLDGYAQAGAILRRGIEHYADGSLRAARPFTSAGPVQIDAGGGAWGGLQRGVARLEIGPSVGARIPLADRVLRVSLDWRQRIAGNARPGSGPALTIGSDF
jgi:hypothetical protein